MSVYWSEQYTCDFFPYLRHIFVVKHIYLTLYIVYIHRITPTYSVPARSHAVLAALFTAFTCSLSLLFAPLACPRSLCCSRPPDARRSCSLSVLLAPLAVAVVPPARSLPAARCPCGRAVRSACLPARVCACARLCSPVCAPADAWSTVDFFVRRPCVACLACPRVCSLRSPAPVPACSRACLLPLFAPIL